MDGEGERTLTQGNIDVIEAQPIIVGSSSGKGSSQLGGYGAKDQGDGRVTAPAGAERLSWRPGRRLGHAIEHCKN